MTPQVRVDMEIALKQMKVKKEYYMKNESTMRELNSNIVRVMSKIDGSLQNMIQAIRNDFVIKILQYVFWRRIFYKRSIRDAKYEFTIRQCVTMAESYIQRSKDEFYTLDEMNEYVWTNSSTIIYYLSF